MQPTIFKANLACFLAMLFWSAGFPAGEVLLESWGTLSLLVIRLSLSVALLMAFWIIREGLIPVFAAPWKRGMFVGSIGFGIGTFLLLVGQKLSDPVTPAIAAAMMPIAGAGLEVLVDKRKLRLHLIIGISLALGGGILATGVKLSEGTFGVGALVCLTAVVLFAWGTRATTHTLENASALGKTTVSLTGGLVFMLIAYIVALVLGFDDVNIGIIDFHNILMILVFSISALAVSQMLWIWGASHLGIMLASLHVNAMPFYVMVIIVLLMDAPWGWDQAFGAGLVAIGVLIAQSSGKLKKG